MKKSSLIALCLACTVTAQAKDYVITNYGAIADTTTLSTQAIQQAIDQCHNDGGGRVVIPKGNFKTGTIILKSKVDLHLDEGATLYGSTDIKDYKKLKPSYVSLRTQKETIQLIYANQATDVSITGKGCIDGQGKGFPKLSWNDEGITRPHLIRFIECRQLNIKGVTLRNSGCWMQHYLACDNVSINGIKVYNRNNYNNDALDLDGCHNIEVTNMTADSDDDGITLKSTSPRLCENIIVKNCVVSSHCNAVKLGTESNGGFKNIHISNITIRPSNDQSTLFFGKSRGISAISVEMVDGGKLSDVVISNIHATGTESPIFVRLGNRARGYYEGQKIENVGTLSNVTLSDITVNDAGTTGCSITGLPGHPVCNIILRNISITHPGGCPATPVPTDEKEKDYPEATMWGTLPAKGFFVRHARNVKFKNVSIKTQNPDERPEYILIDDK